MEIWIATANKGKLNEFKNLFGDLAIEIHSPNELGFYSSPEETGKTFEENARIKAKSLAAVKEGAWVLADDSGLECEGLNQMPGIHSARYAGEKARDSENVAKLLKMLQLRTTNRKAKFVCSLIAISPQGEEKHFQGELKGNIAKKQAGSGGFGYDPVFIPEGFEKTLAELPSNEKNRISHRAKAIRLFKDFLKENT